MNKTLITLLAFLSLVCKLNSQSLNFHAKKNSILATRDSIQKVLIAQKEDTTIIKTLNALCSNFIETNEYDTAIAIAKKAQMLEEKLTQQTTASKPLKKLIAETNFNLGHIYLQQDLYGMALDRFNYVLKIREGLGDNLGIANATNAIGLCYYLQGNYSKALTEHFRSLKISESISNKQLIARTQAYIGNIYYAQNDLQNALNYHTNSLKLSEAIGDIETTAGSFGNIGNIYEEQGKYTEALEMNFKALKLMEKNNNYFERPALINNIGTIYEVQGDHTNAAKMYTQGLKISEEIGDKQGIAIGYLNLGSLYTNYTGSQKGTNSLRSNRSVEAYKNINQALLISKNIGAKFLIKECYLSLSKLDSTNGKWQEAFEGHKLYMAYRDSLMNEENIKKTVRAEMNFNFEKKEEVANAIQHNKNLISMEKQNSQRNIIISISVLLILILTFSVILILGYKNKIRSNAIIASKNKEISNQRSNIEGQELERKRIAKELHDGIASDLASIKLRLIDTQLKTNSDGLNDIISQIDGSCREVRAISHNLMPLNFTNISLNDLLIDLGNKFNSSNKLKIELEYFQKDETILISENIKLEIYRIVQELLHNIVKHAKASVATISLLIENDQVYLGVDDNGIGFNVDAENKGVGITNIESRVISLSGKFIIDSKLQRGTAVNINFPITKNV